MMPFRNDDGMVVILIQKTIQQKIYIAWFYQTHYFLYLKMARNKDFTDFVNMYT